MCTSWGGRQPDSLDLRSVRIPKSYAKEKNMKPEPMPKMCPKDLLVSRPDEPLPTRLDPDSPEARGWPYDPKETPERGQGDPRETNPAPTDVKRSA